MRSQHLHIVLLLLNAQCPLSCTQDYSMQAAHALHSLHFPVQEEVNMQLPCARNSLRRWAIAVWLSPVMIPGAGLLSPFPAKSLGKLKDVGPGVML